ncbi:MAG: four helix bundle protein [Pirellulales bacterium]|nr:four helix bundle protein [Pirellulales bacterium]
MESTTESFAVAKGLPGLHRHGRDPWLRAAQSIPLNIAEGNGKRSPKDRARFFEVARGSALECAAVQDVLAASGGLPAASSLGLKRKLKRIVSMLTRMTMKSGPAAKLQTGHAGAVDDEHEHRCAEQLHEDEPEQGGPPDRDRWSEFRWENRPAGGPGR